MSEQPMRNPRPQRCEICGDLVKADEGLMSWGEGEKYEGADGRVYRKSVWYVRHAQCRDKAPPEYPPHG